MTSPKYDHHEEEEEEEEEKSKLTEYLARGQLAYSENNCQLIYHYETRFSHRI